MIIKRNLSERCLGKTELEGWAKKKRSRERSNKEGKEKARKLRQTEDAEESLESLSVSAKVNTSDQTGEEIKIGKKRRRGGRQEVTRGRRRRTPDTAQVNTRSKQTTP